MSEVVEMLRLRRSCFLRDGAWLCLGLPLILIAGAVEGKIDDAVLVKEDGKLLLKSGAHSAEVVGTRIVWALRGNRLALHQAPNGALSSFTASSGSLKEVAEAATHPLWSADGSRLAFSAPDGSLKVFFASVPSEPPITLASDAIPGAAAWAPDGSRMVYGTLNDIWIVDAFGQERRRLLRNRTAASVAWSSDGKWIAVVERPLRTAAGSLLLVRPSGTGLKKAGVLDASELSFSPNGRWLLARGAKGFTVTETASGRLRSLPVPPASSPVWVGGQKLMFADDDKVQVLSADSGEPRTIRKRSEPKEVLAWAPTPFFEITNDVAVANTFKGLRRPNRGEIRVTGYVDAADPMDGLYTLQVESVLDATGKETYFPRPIPQKLSLPESAQLNLGASNTPLRSVDLRLDSDVSILLQAPAIDQVQTLAIRECAIEGM
ncbi:MAG TPA: hypothetical protein VEX38_06905, partial [Fimbriimonadaceae bacterium]|nr:hypothetical protein [Fimbriimonadaceae bacterium]